MLRMQRRDAAALAYERLVVPRLRPMGEALVARVGPLHDNRVLELAAGTGGLTRLLPPALGLRSSLVAIDLSREMLALAAEALEPIDPRVTLVVADVAALPFLDEAFDLAIGRFTTLQDSPSALREARRVLRRGGRLLLACWGADSEQQRLLDEVRRRVGLDPNPPPSDRALRARLRTAGFRQVQIETEAFGGRYDDAEACILYCRAFGTPPGWDASTRRRVWAAMRAALRSRAALDGSIAAEWVVRFLSAVRPA